MKNILQCMILLVAISIRDTPHRIRLYLYFHCFSAILGFFRFGSEDTYRLTTPYFEIVAQTQDYPEYNYIYEMCLLIFYTSPSPGIVISGSLISRDGRTISSEQGNYSPTYMTKVPMHVELRWEITVRATAGMSDSGKFLIKEITFGDCSILGMFDSQLCLVPVIQI